jgi:hypothetical protein
MLTKGLTGFRNAVDWADQTRDDAISYANTIYNCSIEDAEQKEASRGDSVGGATLEVNDTEEDGYENEDDDPNGSHPESHLFGTDCMHRWSRY